MPELIGLDYHDAVQKGHEQMTLAKAAFAKSTEVHLRIEAIAIDVARANYHQTRALAFYQYASLVRDIA